MCKFCGCAWGRAQHGLLFLEIIGDLLEKQETLGLLVCILTFLFLFSNLFHRSQARDVFGVLVVNSDLQAPSSLLPTLPPPAAHPLSLCLCLCPSCLVSPSPPPPITAVGSRQVSGTMETGVVS